MQMQKKKRNFINTMSIYKSKKIKIKNSVSKIIMKYRSYSWYKIYKYNKK